MDYRKLSTLTWNELDTFGNIVSGYTGRWLSSNDNLASPIHIFKDETKRYHLTIEINGTQLPVQNVQVNGLSIGPAQYRISGDQPKHVIDLCCNSSGYLEEFTEIAKEISRNILDNHEKPIDAVNRVVRNWISFWSIPNKNILSDNEIIGLICELDILTTLLQINAPLALISWTGPNGSRHDFTFTDWTMEVKGTKNGKHAHIINGIDQLKPVTDKSLAILSCVLIESDLGDAISLQSLIDTITEIHLQLRPDLTVRFNELLASVGYSPLYASEYKKRKFKMVESTLFELDDSFPKLTSDDLINPLNSRISSVKYTVTLEGFAGANARALNWGKYFY